MRYELMFPSEIRQAIHDNIPIVLALGVLEYHGEHLVAGVDTLVITRALDQLEQEIRMVILPPYYYGASSYAVEGPEGTGTIHIDSNILLSLATSLFTNLLRIGFRNIYVLVHHQSENFEVGMPTDLSFKLAAKQATFSYLEKIKGEGWWGRNESSDYYAAHDEGEDPFNWIKICPLLSKDIQKKHPIDHAGRLETAMMMSLCPEGIDMNLLDKKKWYTQTASLADESYGNQVVEAVLSYLRTTLTAR